MISGQSLAGKQTPRCKITLPSGSFVRKPRTNWAWKMNYLVSSNQGLSRLRTKPGGRKGWASSCLPGISNFEDNQMTSEEHCTDISQAPQRIHLENPGTYEQHSIRYYTQDLRQRVMFELLRLFIFVLTIWRIILVLGSLEPNLKINKVLDWRAQTSCLCWGVVSLSKVWQRLIH